ncbi:hypothetical protein U1Q18_008177 [Sarracenia purpurea var. burkii]
MGNCLALQDKLIIKIMEPDGKVLEYKTPMKAHQVLSQFSSHAISDALPAVRHLRPDTKMIGDCRHLYYRVPVLVSQPVTALTVVPMSGKKRVVGYVNPEMETEKGSGRVVRIKVVISRHDLEMMLRKGGVSVVDDIISRIQKKGKNRNDQGNKDSDHDGGNDRICKGWKPVLESIPEVN